MYILTTPSQPQPWSNFIFPLNLKTGSCIIYGTLEMFIRAFAPPAPHPVPSKTQSKNQCNWEQCHGPSWSSWGPPDTMGMSRNGEELLACSQVARGLRVKEFTTEPWGLARYDTECENAYRLRSLPKSSPIG